MIPAWGNSVLSDGEEELRRYLIAREDDWGRHLVAQLATILHALGDAVCACSSSSTAGNNTEGVGDDACVIRAMECVVLPLPLPPHGEIDTDMDVDVDGDAPPDDVVLALVVRAAPPHKPGRSAPEPEGACGGAGIHRCAPSSSDLRFIIDLRVLVVQAACTAPIAAVGPAGRGGAWGARSGCTGWEGAELAQRRTSTTFLAVQPGFAPWIPIPTLYYLPCLSPGRPPRACILKSLCAPTHLPLTLWDLALHRRGYTCLNGPHNSCRDLFCLPLVLYLLRHAPSSGALVVPDRALEAAPSTSPGASSLRSLAPQTATADTSSLPVSSVVHSLTAAYPPPLLAEHADVHPELDQPGVRDGGVDVVESVLYRWEQNNAGAGTAEAT
ncbi:hypothetical protein DFH09DRAFT_1327786 [Mycena vulgaris]|nr:hypothetical protein DFH09DRAFT_1327786 [Mycena vulgaris]